MFVTVKLYARDNGQFVMEKMWEGEVSIDDAPKILNRIYSIEEIDGITEKY